MDKPNLSLSGSDPGRLGQGPQQTQKKPISASSRLSESVESVRIQIQEQQTQPPPQRLQPSHAEQLKAYTEGHRTRIEQQKQKEQEKLDQILELERQRSSEKAIKETKQFLKDHKNEHKVIHAYIRLLELGADRNKQALIQLLEAFRTFDSQYKVLENPKFAMIMKRFIELCDITGRDRNGNTALMIAISQNNKLHKQAHQDAMNSGDKESSPYDGGLYEKNNVAFIKFLIAVFRERDPTLIGASNRSGKTAFTLAKYNPEIQLMMR